MLSRGEGILPLKVQSNARFSRLGKDVVLLVVAWDLHGQDAHATANRNSLFGGIWNRMAFYVPETFKKAVHYLIESTLGIVR